MLDPGFIARLDRASNGQEVLALLGEKGLFSGAAAELPPLAHEPERAYSRNILAETADCEIMLARWTPGKECAPHDHGASRGFVAFFQGEFEETLYQPLGISIQRAARRTIRPGQLVKVRAGEIHSCCAREGGFSLHIYFPPIRRMRVFDLGRRETLTVAPGAGAWLVQPAELVLAREPWQ